VLRQQGAGSLLLDTTSKNSDSTVELMGNDSDVSAASTNAISIYSHNPTVLD